MDGGGNRRPVGGTVVPCDRRDRLAFRRKHLPYQRSAEIMG